MCHQYRPEAVASRDAARPEPFGRQDKTDKTCKLNRRDNVSSPASRNNLCCCVLPTWWLLRGGCTRSHSEHGRETPQRQWYSVLRRGRVGRCQVCKTQRITINIFSEQKQTSAQPIQRAASAAFRRFRPHEIKANAHRVP